MTLRDFKEQNKDLFKNHIAEIVKLDGNDGKDCIIYFKDPNTTDGNMMFTYINGIIAVSGDYGYAMFNWYNKNNHILAYANFYDISYILSKLVASEEYKKFDVNQFYADFEEFKNDLLEGGYVYSKEELDEIEAPYVENECDVANYFNDFSLVADVYEFGVYDFGIKLSERVYIWWYGLQSALKQLEAKRLF